jgi:hypothetical protein
MAGAFFPVLCPSVAISALPVASLLLLYVVFVRAEEKRITFFAGLNDLRKGGRGGASGNATVTMEKESPFIPAIFYSLKLKFTANLRIQFILSVSKIKI